MEVASAHVDEVPEVGEASPEGAGDMANGREEVGVEAGGEISSCTDGSTVLENC